MKKSVIVFLSLFLFISAPFHANANIVTTTGKYIINAIKHTPGGAKVEATNVATSAKHVVKHGVSSGALGGAIGASIVSIGVGSGVGLAFQAITGLALDAVDWVMDKENNRIKWKKKAGDIGTQKYLYVNSYTSGFNTADAACRAEGVSWKSESGRAVYSSRLLVNSETNIVCILDTHSLHGNERYDRDTRIFVSENPAYEPNPPDVYKSVPLVDLAKKVIEQADAGEVLSQKDIEDYVTHLAKEGELDNELDNATDITKPDEPTKPDDPDKDCPVGTTKEGDVCVKPAPDNAPLFCNQSDFTRKICDWIDWTQVKHDDPLPNVGKVDVIDKSKDLNIDKNRIDFSNQCPAPTPINTSVGGFPVSTELNYQPLCDFFTMLNPFVIGMGGISSALIIAGGARRG